MKAARLCAKWLVGEGIENSELDDCVPEQVPKAPVEPAIDAIFAWSDMPASFPGAPKICA